MLFKAIAKSNYRDSWKGGNFKESNQEKKQRADTKNKAKRIKSDHFTGNYLEKTNIAIATLEPKIIE